MIDANEAVEQLRKELNRLHCYEENAHIKRAMFSVEPIRELLAIVEGKTNA